MLKSCIAEKMKILILFTIQFLLVLSQDAKAVVEKIAVVQEKAVVEEKAEIIEEATWCFIGTVATYPPRPVNCLKANEVFACAYGEARCDGFGYCGTPPCTWRYGKNQSI